MQVGRLQYRDRWFCYDDLLGFTELVRSIDVVKVIEAYEEVISKLGKR